MKFENIQPYENWFWEKNKIELINNYVQKVDAEKKELNFADGTSLSYDKLIIASGSKPNKFGWPGQDLDGVTGMYSYQDLQAIEKHSEGLKHVSLF